MSYPDDDLQPDTQGTDAIEAELGEDGQGDLAPEDLPQQSDAGLEAHILDEDAADPLDEVGTTSPDIDGTSPDRVAGFAPGPGEVTYGDNSDTQPRSAEEFRPENTGIDVEAMSSPGALGESSLDTDATPEGGGTGEGIDGDTSLGDPDLQGEAGAAPVTSVPPGGLGADSGPVESVGVEGSSSIGLERSSQNDFAGVAPAPADGQDPGDAALARAGRTEPASSNAATEPGASPDATDDAPTQHGSDDPDIAGIPDAVGPGGSGVQTGTRQDLNDSSVHERVQGIIVQMQGDLGTDRLAESEVQAVLEERLTQAGISADVEQIEELTTQVVSSAAPADVDEGQPGADT